MVSSPEGEPNAGSFEGSARTPGGPAQPPPPGPSPTPAERALLDAAPGPLHPRARETLMAAIDAGWADPRRLHTEARTARHLLDRAREVVATGLGVSPDRVAFTSSGPEALRTAVAAVRHAGRRRGARVVAGAVEHSAVLLPARHHAAQAGDPDLLAEVPVDARGRVDVGAYAAAVAHACTAVAVLQSANGEVGTRQPVDRVLEVARAAGVPLVVDAQAGLGRDPVPTAYDVLVGDAASFGGPPALGLLVVRPGTPFRSPGPPGEAEHGWVPDGPWLPLALAAAEAWQQTEADREADAAGARDLVDHLRAALGSVPDTEVVGDPTDRLPHVLTVSALYADGEALVGDLDRLGLAVASGSACTSSTLEPSHVLAAMGALTHGSIRLTLPLRSVAPDREAWVERLVEAYPVAVQRIRAQIGAVDL